MVVRGGGGGGGGVLVLLKPINLKYIISGKELYMLQAICVTRHYA